MQLEHDLHLLSTSTLGRHARHIAGCELRAAPEHKVHAVWSGRGAAVQGGGLPGLLPDREPLLPHQAAGDGRLLWGQPPPQVQTAVSAFWCAISVDHCIQQISMIQTMPKHIVILPHQADGDGRLIWGQPPPQVQSAVYAGVHM